MTNLYRVQATIWIEAESGLVAAEETYNNLSQLVGIDDGFIGVEVENDGELVEDVK